MSSPALPSTLSTPLISASELALRLQAREPLVILDCGFDLAQPQAGEAAYRDRHLPGARYAHLDRDLAGRRTGHNGRHPLPDRATFAQTVAGWGIQPGVPVVVYDDQGLPYAARAWWLLRWLGHGPTAVLDGGRAAWQAQGGAWEQAPPAVTPAPPYPASSTPGMATVQASDLLPPPGGACLLDARAGERFRGETEPLDPVAGHIPGALNRFFKQNLQADGRFKPAALLRAEFEALGLDLSRGVVHQCGSGVTACHNLLAMAVAGLGETALYPGSWSEWCSDPSRPVATGGA